VYLYSLPPPLKQAFVLPIALSPEEEQKKLIAEPASVKETVVA
jgi:hypothetical protein